LSYHGFSLKFLFELNSPLVDLFSWFESSTLSISAFCDWVTTITSGYVSHPVLSVAWPIGFHLVTNSGCILLMLRVIADCNWSLLRSWWNNFIAVPSHLIVFRFRLRYIVHERHRIRNMINLRMYLDFRDCQYCHEMLISNVSSENVKSRWVVSQFQIIFQVITSNCLRSNVSIFGTMNFIDSDSKSIKEDGIPISILLQIGL
jgi:hypothetical protein